MKRLVIEISDYDYEEIIEYGLLESPTITEAIRNGIILDENKEFKEGVNKYGDCD